MAAPAREPAKKHAASRSGTPQPDGPGTSIESERVIFASACSVASESEERRRLGFTSAAAAGAAAGAAGDSTAATASRGVLDAVEGGGLDGGRLVGGGLVGGGWVWAGLVVVSCLSRTLVSTGPTGSCAGEYPPYAPGCRDLVGRQASCECSVIQVHFGPHCAL